MATLSKPAAYSSPNAPSLTTHSTPTAAPPPTTAPEPTTTPASTTALASTTSPPSATAPTHTAASAPMNPPPSTALSSPATPAPPATDPASTTASPPTTEPTAMAAPMTTTSPTLTITPSPTTNTPKRNIFVAVIRSELCSGISLGCTTLTLVIGLYKDSYYPPKMNGSDTALGWSLYSFWLATFVWFVVVQCMALREGRQQRQQAPFTAGPPCERPTDFILRLLWCVLAGVVAHLIVVPAVNATTRIKTTLRESLLLFMPFVLTLAAIGSAMKPGPRPPISDVERPQVELSSLLPSGQSSAGTPFPIDNPD